MNSKIIEPYGGHLVNLLLPLEKRNELKQKANSLPFVQLTSRSLCDFEMLVTGAFSPLDRFMGKADYQSAA